MSGTITFTGLGSGIDLQSIVNQLVEAEQYNINRMNTWKSDWENKITALQTLNTKLAALETQASSMDTLGEFLVRTASSSDEAVLTATASSSASTGSHNIEVGENVKHRLACQGFASAGSLVGDAGGSMIIYVGTSSFTIPASAISSSTTLTQLKDLINSYAGGLATAEILNDGSSQNAYRLVITANSGGPSNLVSVPVANNPTNCQFIPHEIGAANNSGVSGTARGTSLGNYTGTISDASKFATYTFRNSTGSTRTVGSGTWNLSWSRDKGGNSGTVSLGSDYTPGDTIQIEDGVFIQVSAGTMANNDSFTVRVFNKDVDAVQNGTWSGSSTVTSGGNYTGTTNKTLNFTISGSGTKTIGTDSFDVAWTDTEGNTGTVSVTPSSYTDLTVYQGVKISFGAGTVIGGDTFSIDVFNANLQAGVSEGIAKAETEIHSGFVDEDTTAVTTAAGTFSYTYAGVARTIDVPADTTLTGLKNLINNDTQNPGITATIINDGTGLSTANHLKLTGNDPGAAYTITNISHTLNNFAKAGTTGFGFSETQSAQNAMVKVDGYPSGNTYIQNSSNNISTVIEGVTLSVLSGGTSTVTIGNDTSEVKTKIEDFVTAFNDVRDNIKELTYYDADTGEHGLLIGNYAVMLVQSRLNNIVSSAAPGFKDGSQTYINLAQVGLETDTDESSETYGQLIIDDATLDSALQNNFDAAGKLFAANFEGYSDHASNAIYQSYIAGVTEPGSYTVKYSISGGNITSAQIKLNSEPDSAYRDASYENTNKTITGNSGYSESGLVVKAMQTANGTYTADIRLLQGISGAITSELSDLNNPNTGPIHILDEYYNEIIDNIDDKIDREERRVEAVRKRLEEQFARLEALLTTLNNQSVALENLITQLPTNNA